MPPSVCLQERHAPGRVVLYAKLRSGRESRNFVTRDAVLAPRLSQMAVDVLSVSPMSAEAKRVFSGARRTISWERAALGSGSIERGECLKSWSIQKIPLLNDIPADETTDEQLGTTSAPSF